MDKTIRIDQSVAILVDGNNIEISIHEVTKNDAAMLNFDTLIPRLLDNRSLNRLVYFREGKHISNKLAERLHNLFHGSESHRLTQFASLNILFSFLKDKVSFTLTK